MHHRTRTAITVLLFAVVAVVVVESRFDQGQPVDIGTAVQTHDAGRSAAAQSAEDVRYDDVDLELVAAYLVEDGRLVSDGVPASHQAAWTAVERVLPEAAIGVISQLNVVTDGANGTLAMVHRSGVDDQHWILSVDVAESTDVLALTLVHEYAHMLTLGRGDLSTAPGTCDGIAMAIGCARHGSVLSAWADQFWVGVTEPATPDADRFVSEYAATSVHEDLAETFLTYVTGDPARRTPAIDAKLAFFDELAEFADGAAALRANLSAP